MDDLKIACPHCSARLSVAQHRIGKPAKCPACGREFVPGYGLPKAECFAFDDGKRVGPYSFSVLKEMAFYGELNETDILWREGGTGWIEAGKVDGLFDGPTPLARSVPAPSRTHPVYPDVKQQAERREPGAREKFCHYCGQIIASAAELCPKCGVRQGRFANATNDAPNKVVACLFALLLGLFGAHHFYLGHTLLGVLYLVLFLFFFWTVIVPVVLAFVCLIEGLVYLTYSDADFANKYRR